MTYSLHKVSVFDLRPGDELLEDAKGHPTRGDVVVAEPADVSLTEQTAFVKLTDSAVWLFPLWRVFKVARQRHEAAA